MAQAAVDWSWGQAYPTHTLDGTTTLNNSDINPQSKPQWQFDPPSLQDPQPHKPAEPFPNGFHINNALRTAVPSPAISEMMHPLSLQPAPPIHARTPSIAGRKRSCAEISDVDDSSDPHSASSHSGGASGSPTKFARADAGDKNGMNGTYGSSQQNMDDGGSMDATSHSGVWAEELSDRLRSSSFPGGVSRPRTLESRKSIRLDPERNGLALPTLPEHIDDNGMVLDEGQCPLQPQDKRRNTETVSSHTLSGASFTTSTVNHDEARLALGVGWSSLAATPMMLAAARGWAKHIENAFHLHNARILWRNEGLGAFLVSVDGSSARTDGRGKQGCGYYLFDEALTQGRLVARSWERALEGLRSVPFAFERSEVMGVENEADKEAEMFHLQLLDEGDGGEGRGLARDVDDDDRFMGMEIE